MTQYRLEIEEYNPEGKAFDGSLSGAWERVSKIEGDSKVIASALRALANLLEPEKTLVEHFEDFARVMEQVSEISPPKAPKTVYRGDSLGLNLFTAEFPTEKDPAQ